MTGDLTLSPSLLSSIKIGQGSSSSVRQGRFNGGFCVIVSDCNNKITSMLIVVSVIKKN